MYDMWYSADMTDTVTPVAKRFSVRGLDYSTVDIVKALAFRYRVTQGEVVEQAVLAMWKASELARIKDKADYDAVRADWPPSAA